MIGRKPNVMEQCFVHVATQIEMKSIYFTISIVIAYAHLECVTFSLFHGIVDCMTKVWRSKATRDLGPTTKGKYNFLRMRHDGSVKALRKY